MTTHQVHFVVFIYVEGTLSLLGTAKQPGRNQIISLDFDTREERTQ